MHQHNYLSYFPKVRSTYATVYPYETRNSQLYSPLPRQHPASVLSADLAGVPTASFPVASLRVIQLVLSSAAFPVAVLSTVRAIPLRFPACPGVPFLWVPFLAVLFPFQASHPDAVHRGTGLTYGTCVERCRHQVW